jgi:hypothetical protein
MIKYFFRLEENRIEWNQYQESPHPKKILSLMSISKNKGIYGSKFIEPCF